MKKKMLFLTDMLPAKGISGARVRNYFILEKLSEFFDLTLIALVRRDEKYDKYLNELNKFCEEVIVYRFNLTFYDKLKKFLNSIIRGYPFLVKRLYFRDLHTIIKKVVKEKNIDVIHFGQLNMSLYAFGLGGKKILDNHNAHYIIPKRLSKTLPLFSILKFFSLVEYYYLKKFEGKIFNIFEGVLTVSEEDKKRLETLNNLKSHNIFSLPISIDINYYKYSSPNYSSNKILHLGTLRWFPNKQGLVWFLKDVWPFINKERKDLSLLVVGDSFGFKTRERNVFIKGFVDNIEEVWREVKCLVVPLKIGGGVRVKILEAWARGVPVVSTSIGCEGLKAVNNENILIADTPHEFYKAVLKIFSDDKLCKRLSLNGRKTVENFYDSDKVYKEGIEYYLRYFFKNGGNIR